MTGQPQTEPAANQQNKPVLNMSDSEAQSLLSINNLQAWQQPKTKPPTKLLIAALALIVFAILVSVLLGSYKPGGGSKSTSAGGLGLPNQSNPTSGNDVNNQINQDTKTCSNPVNASLVC